MQDATNSAKKRSGRPSTPKKAKQQKLDAQVAEAAVELARLKAVDAEHNRRQGQLATSVSTSGAVAKSPA